MDTLIFKKMRLKLDWVATVLYAPEGYSKTEDIKWQDAGQSDFVHLFVESREQFSYRFQEAVEACGESLTRVKNGA